MEQIGISLGSAYVPVSQKSLCLIRISHIYRQPFEYLLKKIAMYSFFLVGSNKTIFNCMDVHLKFGTRLPSNDIVFVFCCYQNKFLTVMDCAILYCVIHLTNIAFKLLMCLQVYATFQFHYSRFIHFIVSLRLFY